MNIDKGEAVKVLQDHKSRYEWNINGKPTDYDSGYLMGLNIAIKMINLQPESGIGQVTFNFDSNG